MASEKYSDARDQWQDVLRIAVQANQPAGQIYDLLQEANSDLASKADVLFEEREWKPRGKKLAEALKEYYEVEIERFGAEPDWEGFYAKRDAIIDANPGLDEAIRNGVAKRWTDLVVREFALKVHDARPIRTQYFDIPPYVGISAEEGQEVNRILAEASAMVRLGQAGSRRGAIYAIYERDRFSDEVAYIALYSQRFANPERQAFRQQHPDELAIFEPIPYSPEDEE